MKNCLIFINTHYFKTFPKPIKGGSMKSLISVVSVLLFAHLALAQTRPPAPAPVKSPRDTIQMAANCPDREANPMAGPMSMCPREKQLFPGHGMNFRPDMMQPGCCMEQCPGFGKGNRHPWRPHDMRFCPPRVFCGIIFLGILFWGIINILLTIIVSLDMTKSGRFNGLWIPLLLIAGIPGSIIYALFRIGDRIPCSGKN